MSFHIIKKTNFRTLWQPRMNESLRSSTFFLPKTAISHTPIEISFEKSHYCVNQPTFARTPHFIQPTNIYGTNRGYNIFRAPLLPLSVAKDHWGGNILFRSLPHVSRGATFHIVSNSVLTAQIGKAGILVSYFLICGDFGVSSVIGTEGRIWIMI